MLVLGLSWMVSLLLLCQYAACHDDRHEDSVKTVTVCQGKRFSLSCSGSELINIREATYGRSNKKVCCEGRRSNEVSNCRCSHASAKQIVSRRCDGKKSCCFTVDRSIFSDPCSGTFKYLTVTYECRRKRDDGRPKCSRCP